MGKLENVILFLMDQTSKGAKRFTQQKFDQKGLGITVDQWVLLKIIEENDGASQKELSQAAIRDGASITRSLDILQNKNFIKRESIPDNRRQYRISVTQSGKRFITKNMALVNQQRALSVKGFSKKELMTLQEMLQRIRKNMS